MAKRKKVNTIILHCMTILFVYGYGCTSYAVTEIGHGRVDIHGSIIDTACAIMTEDREQSIEMDALTLGQIRHDRFGPDKKFSIRLVNCSLTSANLKSPDWSHFRMTFDGPSGDGLFTVTGVSGVGLQIIDTAGNIAVPGQPMPGGILTPGTQQLVYILRLTSNKHRLIAGEYHTTLRFKVDYF